MIYVIQGGHMTVTEARKIVEELDDGRKFTDDEEFMFIEAMNFLIEEEKNPGDMMWLGGYYYEQKRFDLALKYYEMAASLEYDEAYECLGYIWYYGRTGERDFKKAFKYFSKLRDKGDLVAAYKVADMYKNGYYVEKDVDKYKDIIEKLYVKVQSCGDVFDPVPEVYTRLARIRTEEGKTDEAVNLYLKAKNWLAQRIKFNAFFGNLNIMKWLVNDLYKLIDFDKDTFDLFDMYYLMKTPHKVRFYFRDQMIEVESFEEGDEVVLSYKNSYAPNDIKWFQSIDDFFGKAIELTTYDRLVKSYDSLYGFEVIE